MLRDIRSRLLVSVLVTVGFALVAATLGFTLLLKRTVENNVDAVLRQRVDSERAVLHVRDGRLTPAETGTDAAADSRVWVFRGTRALEAPQAQAATTAAVRSLVGKSRRFLDVPSTDVRLYAVPIKTSGGHRLGTIVVGVSVAPYEETRHIAVVGAALFASLLLALVAAAAWWLLRAALHPVAQMTEQAEAWSEHDLGGRFAAGEPHDELSMLAATLDRLLDRIGSSLRHERRFTAELAHEVRTPLSRAIGEAELALRRERSGTEYRDALELVLRNARQVARIVDALVAAAQHEASPMTGTADASEVAGEVVAAMSPLAVERGVELTASSPAGRARVGVDGDLAARVLQPVVENACRYARSCVTIDIEERDGLVVFHVVDDGPGVGEDEADAVFDPGVRGSAASGTAGAGLGLSLARRVARTISGDVTAAPGAGRGDFTVVLPGA